MKSMANENNILKPLAIETSDDFHVLVEALSQYVENTEVALEEAEEIDGAEAVEAQRKQFEAAQDLLDSLTGRLTALAEGK